MENRLLKSIKTGLADICYIWRKEYVAVFRDMGAMLFFFALPFAYPLLYAFIYNPEVVNDVPLAVVDNSRTQLSREMCRRIDASPNTKVLSYCANLDEAKELMYQRDCFGILEIPADFDKKLARGEQSPVVFYSDMSLLLNYKNFLITLTDVSLDMGRELQSRTLTGATPAQIDMVTDPIPSFSFTLYNPTGGFASFVIPALLIVIMQQSLILGIGMLAGGIYEHRKLRHYYQTREKIRNNILHLVLGKAICYYSLYIVTTMYMLHIIPWFFDYPQLGDQWEIYAFMAPFLLSTIFFGMTLSVFIRERESVFLIIVFTSMIFLFVSGITWPYDRMPAVWQVLGSLVPSTWGVEGFIRMNTEGASISDVKGPFLHLWGLTIFYFITTCIAYSYQIWKDKQRRRMATT